MQLILAHWSESPHTSLRWYWRTFQSGSICKEFAGALLVFRGDCIVSPEKKREEVDGKRELKSARHTVPRCWVSIGLWYLAAVRDSLPSVSLHPHPPTPVHHSGPCCHGNWRSKSPQWWRESHRRDLDRISGMWSDIKHAKLSLFFSCAVRLSPSVSEFTMEELKVCASVFKRPGTSIPSRY